MTDNFDFLELMEKRYSVRRFSDTPIENGTIEKILRAGQVAPTACNNQPQRILVINSDEGLKKLRRCTECHFNAPAAMLICYNNEECWKRSYDGKASGDIDASIVTTHMMLEAASLGVGTTWVMHFIPEAVKCEFKVPDNIEPVAILIMGYPSSNAKPAPGHSDIKPIGDTVMYNSFDNIDKS